VRLVKDKSELGMAQQRNVMKKITELLVPQKQGISCQLISSHFFKKFLVLPGKETEP
jgi:hypothetical protein